MSKKNKTSKKEQIKTPPSYLTKKNEHPPEYDHLCFEEKITYLILKCIASMKVYDPRAYGFKKVGDILKGTYSMFNLENGHYHNPCFGVLHKFTTKQIYGFLEELFGSELILITPGPFPVIEITVEGWAVLEFEEEIFVPLMPFSLTAMETAAFDKDLLTYLFNCRQVQAKDEGIPAYSIIPNRTLIELSVKQPIDLESLSNIKGFGETRTAKYGEMFINALDDYNTNKTCPAT